MAMVGRSLAVEILVLEAIQGGVQVLRHGARCQPQRIQLGHEVPIHLRTQAPSPQSILPSFSEAVSSGCSCALPFAEALPP